ncbi:MAG: excinuclease ABC subunit C [Clostridia bacterium]|nr:excinuclease ABC subunit C [Clostridia bacterium]
MEEEERIKRIKGIIKNIPLNPGIYMMKDKSGTIIYVGKAISLRKRVSQYFNKNPKSARIMKMTTLVENIEYIVTNNEVEALNLECNYIKNFNPKFNVMLKDDKTYPYLKITTKEKYPRMFTTRRKIEDGSMYFGPYTSVKSIREVMTLIKEIFPLKRCKYNLEKNKNIKPCLYYDIGRCIGPCKKDVDEEEYRKMIKQVIMFLNGKNAEIRNEIKKEIDTLIEKLEFEKAAKLKDRLVAIEKVNEKQNVSNLNEINTDIVGYILNKETLYIQIFKIRGYKIIVHDNLKINEVEEEEKEEILLSCISQYYTKNPDMPDKIYIKLNDENSKLLDGLLEKVEVIVPKKGSKLKLIEMTENNITINLSEKELDKLAELKTILKEDFSSIECYDISNLRNDYIVGAMIRCDDGYLNKKMYRKFKIKSTLVQNDPLCMYEVIKRRMSHPEWEYPDVMFIDGGITQVNAAKKAVNEAGIDILICGMVKNDKHRTRGLINSEGEEYTNLSKRTLNFITFLQDEIHRFVITYHRSLRDKMK